MMKVVISYYFQWQEKPKKNPNGANPELRNVQCVDDVVEQFWWAVGARGDAVVHAGEVWTHAHLLPPCIILLSTSIKQQSTVAYCLPVCSEYVYVHRRCSIEAGAVLCVQCAQSGLPTEDRVRHNEGHVVHCDLHVRQHHPFTIKRHLLDPLDGDPLDVFLNITIQNTK